jgi:peroxiredoxin
LLSDTTGDVGAAYDIVRGPDERSPGTPRRVTYLIDPGGVIRKVYVVKDIEAHPDQVLEDARRVATTAG